MHVFFFCINVKFAFLNLACVAVEKIASELMHSETEQNQSFTQKTTHKSTWRNKLEKQELQNFIVFLVLVNYVNGSTQLIFLGHAYKSFLSKVRGVEVISLVTFSILLLKVRSRRVSTSH